jgi:hypothetical protein
MTEDTWLVEQNLKLALSSGLEKNTPYLINSRALNLDKEALNKSKAEEDGEPSP